MTAHAAVPPGARARRFGHQPDRRPLSGAMGQSAAARGLPRLPGICRHGSPPASSRSATRSLSCPGAHTTSIAGIQVMARTRREAYPPSSVTMLLADKLDISRGDMFCRPQNRPLVTRELEAMVCAVWDTPHPPGRALPAEAHDADGPRRPRRAALQHRREHAPPEPGRDAAEHERGRSRPPPHRATRSSWTSTAPTGTPGASSSSTRRRTTPSGPAWSRARLRAAGRARTRSRTCRRATRRRRASRPGADPRRRPDRRPPGTMTSPRGPRSWRAAQDLVHVLIDRRVRSCRPSGPHSAAAHTGSSMPVIRSTDPPAHLPVQALDVAGLADVHRRVDEDLEELVSPDQRPRLIPVRSIRADQGADRRSLVSHDFRGDPAHGQHVSLPVDPAEASLREELLTNDVAIEQRDGPAGCLQDLGKPRRRGRLARPAQPGQPDADAGRLAPLQCTSRSRCVVVQLP